MIKLIDIIKENGLKYKVVFFDYNDDEYLAHKIFNSKQDADDFVQSNSWEEDYEIIDSSGENRILTRTRYYNPEDSESYFRYEIYPLGEIDESTNPNIYKIEGKLVVNTEERAISDILSDVRAIPGITVVTTRNVEEDPNPRTKRHVVTLSIKIDPAPFKPFSKETFKKILLDIKKVPSVLTAKFEKNLITI